MLNSIKLAIAIAIGINLNLNIAIGFVVCLGLAIVAGFGKALIITLKSKTQKRGQ